MLPFHCATVIRRGRGDKLPHGPAPHPTAVLLLTALQSSKVSHSKSLHVSLPFGAWPPVLLPDIPPLASPAHFLSGSARPPRPRGPSAPFPAHPSYQWLCIHFSTSFSTSGSDPLLTVPAPPRPPPASVFCDPPLQAGSRLLLHVFIAYCLLPRPA